MVDGNNVNDGGGDDDGNGSGDDDNEEDDDGGDDDNLPNWPPSTTVRVWHQCDTLIPHSSQHASEQMLRSVIQVLCWLQVISYILHVVCWESHLENDWSCCAY